MFRNPNTSADGINPRYTRVPDPSKPVTVAKTFKENGLKDGHQGTQKLREQPGLSLTKLDFELLREWNLKERQKRLETWGQDLGLSKKDIHFRKEIERKHGHKSKAHHHKHLSTVTSRAILKREVEHITGLRVYAGTKPKEKKKPGTALNKPSTLTKSGSSTKQLPRVAPAPKKQEPQLNALLQMSSKVVVKKTFGKTWGEKEEDAPKRRPSLNNITPNSSQFASRMIRRSMNSRKESSDTTSDKDFRAKAGSFLRTDIEEEQQNTDYTTTRTTSPPDLERQFPAPPSPTGSDDSVGLGELFGSIRSRVDDGLPVFDDGDEPEKEKHKRPEVYEPILFVDTVFGGVKFVPKKAVKPVGKLKTAFDFEELIGADDSEQHDGSHEMDGHPEKITFFNNDEGGNGRSQSILAKKAAHKAAKNARREAKRRLEQERAERAARIAEQAQRDAMEREAERLLQTALHQMKLKMLDPSDIKNRKEFLNFQKALLALPGVTSQWNIEMESKTEEGPPQGRVKHTQFGRPGRRIWYTPLPLKQKRFYKTNWKKIRFDVRSLMQSQNFWPKMWIAFEENHPKQLFDLVRAKLTMKAFEKLGHDKPDYDWSKGVHPDYVDWVLEDIVPHPGPYHYEATEELPFKEPVRKASIEAKDIKVKEWFVKPPRYIQDSPVSPPFNMYDFCGYGNRKKPYFLPETLPREIVHCYEHPAKNQRVFKDIPMPTWSYPGYMFKRWGRLPLDQKLPQYYPFPKRLSMWSMGHVGEPVQCNSTLFYLDDPYLKLRNNTYSPYHDPHLRKYVLRKDVLDRIWSMGIINSKGEVNCTMEEFNKNRIYLRDHEWKEEAMRRWENVWKEKQTTISLAKSTNLANMNFDGRAKARQQKMQNMKRICKIREEEKKRRFKERAQIKKRRMEAVMRRKYQENEERKEIMRQRRELARERLNAVAEFDNLVQTQGEIWADYKLKRAAHMRKAVALEKVCYRMQKSKDWWRRSVERHNEKVAEMKGVVAALQDEMKMKVSHHKQEAAKKWAELPIKVMMRKERELRRLQLSRKYFRMWRKKVARAVRRRVVDPEHESMWDDGSGDHGKHFERSLKYLRDQSGYRKAHMNMFSWAVHHRKSLEKHENGYEGDDENDLGHPNSILYRGEGEAKVSELSDSGGDDKE